MKCIIIAFLSTLTLVRPSPDNNLMTAEDLRERFENAVKNGIVKLKNPTVKAVAEEGSKQCPDVKKFLHLSYEQLAGEREPNVNQLKIYFKQRSQLVSYNITTAAQDVLNTPGYDSKKKIYIYLHGFIDDPSKAGFSNISEALLSRGETNVLALDGSSLIHWLYLRSTTYVRFMGEKLGEVLAAMVHNGVDPAFIHLIGHSLGAHIAGFAAKTFAELTGYKIGRISGLDPAGPCFTEIKADLRLNATDADFVDVIHTDAGVFGLTEPVGDVDYYPNSGFEQPNCLFQTCSHSRAWLLYTESIRNPQAFPAKKCKDWESFKNYDYEDDGISYMGFPSKAGTNGTYYLQTGGKSPYGLGEDGLSYEEHDVFE